MKNAERNTIHKEPPLGAITLSDVFIPSENIVARNIAGETIIVPITSGVGDLEDDLYCLNATGQKIWDLFNGSTSLVQIIDLLEADYDTTRQEIEEDVRGLIAELAKRNIITKLQQ